MFVENLAPFFADFGVSAQIGDPATAVTVIFDDSAEDSFGLVATTAPTLLLPTDALPPVSIGSPVVVAGASYTIAALHPDGTGVTQIRLK